MVTQFLNVDAEPAVQGFLHEPESPVGDSLLLAHGAGSNCQSKLLVGIANAFMEAGVSVLRIDLPFRQKRPHGPPFPNAAERDRQGIRRAITLLRSRTQGRVIAGGHSYGGRQTTMLIAEEPALVDALFLLSYPLHPPGKANQLRTGHFPKIQTPAFFVHGTRDPFGSIDEMKVALELITAPRELLEVGEAGHDLTPRKQADLYIRTANDFLNFVRAQTSA